MLLSRASSAKLPARSASPEASAASILSWIRPGLFRRAELTCRLESSAGSSCAASTAQASLACGHSTAAMTALTAMHATARLSLARLGFARFIAEKTGPSVALKIVCQFPDTTAPTKEGLSEDDKIVSNLHEQMSRRGI